jgi:putative oxidoreductase
MVLCSTSRNSYRAELFLSTATRYELCLLSNLRGTSIMNAFDNIAAKYQPIALSLLRFITGLLLFQYGVAKIFKFPVLPYFANIPPLITAAGTLELVLGAVLMIGLFTRIAAFILSGEMAFAYFLGHMFKKPDEPVLLPLLNGGTAAILFCFACLYLTTAGGGSISADAMRAKK